MENNIDLILAQLHMAEEELFLLAGLAFIQAQQGAPRRRKQRRRRRWWIKPYLQLRPLFGQYENLMIELIKPDLFQEFVERVGSLVKKNDTFWRKALNPVTWEKRSLPRPRDQIFISYYNRTIIVL